MSETRPSSEVAADLEMSCGPQSPSALISEAVRAMERDNALIRKLKADNRILATAAQEAGAYPPLTNSQAAAMGSEQRRDYSEAKHEYLQAVSRARGETK